VYRPGTVLEAVLADLPQLHGWTIPATALVLDHTDGELLLYLAGHVANGSGMYVSGRPTTTADARQTVLDHPITTGPQPGQIRLGTVVAEDAELGGMVHRAGQVLALHRLARGTGPLTTADLPVLDLACSELAARRAFADDAEQARDRIIGRFGDGRVSARDLERPGLRRSRISQIITEHRTAGTPQSA
jgi:hypothetical protein